MKRLAEGVWVSGQIQPSQLEELARAGFAILVNHRPDDEEPGQPTAAELAEAARGHGMAAVSAPVSGMPGADAVEATARALASLDDGQKAVMFCRSGMRSTAAWAMVRRREGADADDLRTAAAEAGYDLSRLPL